SLHAAPALRTRRGPAGHASVVQVGELEAEDVLTGNCLAGPGLEDVVLRRLVVAVLGAPPEVLGDQVLRVDRPLPEILLDAGPCAVVVLEPFAAHRGRAAVGEVVARDPGEALPHRRR